MKKKTKRTIDKRWNKIWCEFLKEFPELVSSIPYGSKLLGKLNRFFKSKFSLQEEELRGEIIEFLERVKLELDVCVCDCGDKWSDSDLANLVNDKLQSLKRRKKQ